MHFSNNPIPEALIRLLGRMSNPFISKEINIDLPKGITAVTPDMFMYAVRKHNLPLHWQPAYNSNPLLAAIKNDLQAYHQQRMIFGLQLQKEWLAITKQLQQHNIAFMWVKGFLIRESFYPKAEHRFFNDLDMLVNPADMSEAITILKDLGYRPIGHQPSGQKQHRKNIMLRKEGQSVILEVHYSLLSFFYKEWTWPRQEKHLKNIYTSEGLTLTTFQAEHYLVYLALHGSVHRWHRLFWLRDMVMILHTLEPEQVFSAYRVMKRKQTHLSLLLPIVLAHDIFQMTIDPYRSLIKGQEKTLDKLKKYCLHTMQYRNIVTTTFRWEKLRYYRLLYPNSHLRLKILWHILLRKLGV